MEVSCAKLDPKRGSLEFVGARVERNLLGSSSSGYGIISKNNRKLGRGFPGFPINASSRRGSPSEYENLSSGCVFISVKSGTKCVKSFRNKGFDSGYRSISVHCAKGGRSSSRNGKVEGLRPAASEKPRRGGRDILRNPSKGKGLSYGGRIPSVLQALDDIEDLDNALKPWEASLNCKEISIILKEQWRWERALDIFGWLKEKGSYELNVIHYNIMFGILGRSHQWNNIRRFWEEMKVMGIIPTNPTYGTLIDSYSKAGLKDEALMWLDDMRSRRIKPDEVTMGIVVQTFKRAKEFEKADQFFKEWSSDASLSDACDGSNASQKLNFQQVNSLSAPPPQKFYSSYTYNTLIDTYGKAGQLQEASNLFNQMLKDGIVPNTITFNTMIHICGNHGLIEEADALLLKMEDLRCLPDARTYNILMSLHVKNQNINMVSCYFAKMKESGLKPDHVSYRTLLYAFSDRNMVEEVESVIAEMDQEGVYVDEFIQTTVMRMYIDVNMLERSWAWFERFHLGKEEMSSECYSAIIDAYGERGYLLEAEKVFHCCSDKQRLSVTEFNVMIKAYGKVKMYDKACQLIETMESYGILPDKCTYNSLIQIFSSAGLPYKARSYISKMQEGGFVDDCVPYCAIISSFIKLGRLEKAEELFQDMVISGVKPDIVVFGILINAFAEIGSVGHVKRYFSLMYEAGFSGNSVIFNSLIKLYTKLGCLREAEEIYKLHQSSDDRPDVYSSNCMIDLYSQHSMVNDAEEIFKYLKCQGIANEFSYSMMLFLYKKVGRFSEASYIAQEMQALGLLSKTLSYNNVICLYASTGRYREAVETFSRMIESRTLPDGSTYKTLRTILIKGGVSKEAVNQLKQKQKENALCGTHAWLATLCAMVGMHNEAQQACFTMRQFSETADAPRSMSLATGGSGCAL
ncbi:Pentatricopeptide repeat-containing protein [Nymphaea thermarum]|nr:Pentatricopeptide repeat-containing protein [Nymphaea thermarum]